MQKPRLTEVLPGMIDPTIQNFAVGEVRHGLSLIGPAIDCCTIHCVLSGTLHLSLAGRAPIEAPQGSIALLPSGQGYVIAASKDPARAIVPDVNTVFDRGGLTVFDAARRRAGDLRILMGQITPGAAVMLGLNEWLTTPLVEDLSEVEVVRAAFSGMREEIDRPGIGSGTLAVSVMKTCLVYAMRRLTGRTRVRAPVQVQRLETIVAAIIADPSAAYSVDSLAEQVGISRATFVRQFGKLTGMSPMEFVMKTRLDRAAELLRTTTIPVKVVAGMIGFQDRSNFSRAFARAFGSHPSDYRQSSELRIDDAL